MRMAWPRGVPRPIGSGRRSGTPNRLTLELRGVVREALREAGGVDYLAEVARTRPDLFMPLVRRILPRNTDSFTLEEAAQALGQPVMAAQDAPGATIEAQPSLGEPVSLVSAALLARLLTANSAGAPR